ncbi:trypsin-1 [Lepeophtheirus salmonis]|uniref:trypsin-1 n=1 Tax=Lepeophtheirus salmonis TaxID=72036 RepID=UPI001AE359C2|nr:trypsin-1-like [Lepeophtheirus salmonis]
MLRNICLLLTLALCCTNAKDFTSEYRLIHAMRYMGESKIVGGTEAQPHSIPFQVSFQRKNGFHFCGGSILDETTVITAGHCCKGFSINDVQVVVGAHDFNSPEGTEQTQNIVKITYHENFASKGINNDICLLEVEHPFEFNDNVKPVTLPENEFTPTGEVVVSGWGTLRANGNSSPVLRTVTLNMVPYLRCYINYIGGLDESMICASGKGKDSCQGDSGGPLVQENTLVGIVSWGIGCAHPWFPGVYTKVSMFIDWIHENK